MLESLEAFRQEVEGLFERAPGDIAVVLHPRPAALTLAHPWHTRLWPRHIDVTRVWLAVNDADGLLSMLERRIALREDGGQARRAA